MANFWDDFLADADKDTRVGKHTFLITDVVHDTWPNDGRARHKFRGTLVTAGNSKCDMTMNDMPTEADAKAAKDAGDMKRIRGVALSYRNHANLAGYGKNVNTLAVGDEIAVETNKDKEGFVRVFRVLAKGETLTQVKASSGVPF